MHLSRKRRLIGGGITVLVLGVVGLVYAAWITNGSGSGYAQAGSAQALTTVDVSASTVADLYPTTDGTVAIEISNPNSYDVTVTDIDGNGAATVHTAGIGTCTTTGVTFNDQSGLTIAVPAGGASGVQLLANAAHMSNGSDTGCQDAKFELPVTLTGTSAP